MQVSQFVEFSDRVLTHHDGSERVGVYVTNIPRLIFIPLDLARQVGSGEIETLSPDAARALQRAGVLTMSAAEDRAAVVSEMAEAELDPSVRSFVLLPSSYCNMSCSYCGQEHLRGTMAPDHRTTIEERVIGAIRDPTVEHVHVAWFGAEPLMAYARLMDMAQKFIGEADLRGVRYTSKITTNGALLSERKLLSLWEDARVSRLDITLDGPEHIHDAHRPLKSGKGSFASLVNVLKWAARESRLDTVQFILRTNVDRHNIDYIDEYLTMMAESGLTSEKFVYQLSPIHSWGNDISELERESEAMAKECDWFRTMEALGLKHKLLPAKISGSTCVATHVGSEVIDKDGRMYSCTEQPLVPRDKFTTMITSVSNLAASAKRPLGSLDEWSAQVKSRPELPCSTCSLLPVCGGGCPKRWNEGERACPTLRATVRQRISLLAQRNGYVAGDPFHLR
ncbi:radical SAM protein [Microbacterium sp.]|uniref:radical SAM protein n=1 Tax=Microbacterium sp. TaxID=51671 RepID=UPI0039E5BAC5